ncbi:hypothetical protein [Streptomyces sp. NPDC054940]
MYGVTESPAGLGADLEAMVTSDLAAYSPDELIAELDDHSDPEERASTVIRAGLGAPPRFDERFFTRIRAALDDDPKVWHSALLAIAYTPWPEYADPIARAIEHEPDEDLRETLRVLAGGLYRDGTPAGPATA